MNRKLKSLILNFKNHEMENILDRKIYRYLPYNDLRTAILRGETTYSNPSVWSEHDPYENVFFSIPIENRKRRETIHLDRLTEHYYAQCWTLNRESDLMWQIYRGRYTTHGAVKIQTTIRKLLQAQRHDFLYFGKVRYLRSPSLVKEWKAFTGDLESNLLHDGGSGKEITKKLLIKRFPYNSEREVRLIVADFNAKTRLPVPKHISCEFDANKVIEKVVFDPRMDFKEYKKKKNSLMSLGFENDIIKSALYRLKTNHFTD